MVIIFFSFSIAFNRVLVAAISKGIPTFWGHRQMWKVALAHTNRGTGSTFWTEPFAADGVLNQRREVAI